MPNNFKVVYLPQPNQPKPLQTMSTQANNRPANVLLQKGDVLDFTGPAYGSGQIATFWVATVEYVTETYALLDNGVKVARKIKAGMVKHWGQCPDVYNVNTPGAIETPRVIPAKNTPAPIEPQTPEQFETGTAAAVKRITDKLEKGITDAAVAAGFIAEPGTSATVVEPNTPAENAKAFGEALARIPAALGVSSLPEVARIIQGAADYQDQQNEARLLGTNAISVGVALGWSGGVITEASLVRVPEPPTPTQAATKPVTLHMPYGQSYGRTEDRKAPARMFPGLPDHLLPAMPEALALVTNQRRLAEAEAGIQAAQTKINERRRQYALFRDKELPMVVNMRRALDLMDTELKSMREAADVLRTYAIAYDTQYLGALAKAGAPFPEDWNTTIQRLRAAGALNPNGEWTDANLRAAYFNKLTA